VINVQDIYFHLANIQPFNFPLSHTFITVTDFLLKGLVHPKMKILSVITHPHVVPTP